MRKNCLILNIGLLFSLLVMPLGAQELLTLEEAVSTGLENDFGIRILRNNEQVAANNNSAGNAGFLPSAGFDGDLTIQRLNTEQRFINGESSISDGANSTRVDMGFGLDWTAFDGFRMFARKDRFELLEMQAREETKAAMEGLVADIQLAYLQLIRVNEQQDVVRHSLDLHRSLLTQAEEKLRLGAGTRLAVLQGSNRVQADSVRLVELEAREQQDKIALNRLLRRSPGHEFEVDTTFRFPEIVSKEEVINRIKENNYDLRLLNMDIRSAQLEHKEIKSALYPTLDLNAGYGYVYQKSDAGFLLSNRSYGPVGGATLTYDLFTGRSVRKDLQSADLFIENLEISHDQAEHDLISLAEQHFANYLSYRRLEQLEVSTLQLAIENTSVAREMYRLGKATDYELREAILTEIQSRDRVVEARYQQQVKAVQLMALTGNVMGW